MPYCLTLLLGLFVSVQVGMIAGTLAHLSILVYFSSRPKVSIRDGKVDNVSYVLVTPDRGLFFPSVDEMRSRLVEAASSKKTDVAAEEELPVIVDMSNVVEMDFTAATVRVKCQQEVSTYRVRRQK